MSLHSLMFGWEYPPLHLGGLGVACQGLVHGLAHHGVQVTLVLPHPNAESTQGVDVIYPTEELVKTVRIGSLLSPYDSIATFAKRLEGMPREMSDIYGHNLGEAISGYTELSVAMTQDVHPDVVHTHDWMTYGAGIRAARHHHIPLVAHIHATEMDRTHFQPHQWIYDREREGFEAADVIIAVSDYTKRILVEHYGISPEKIRVVHNGSAEKHALQLIKKKKFATQKKHPMILFLGRLTIQKGASQFLDMASKIHALRPEVQFVIAGDGNMLEELVKRACDLDLRDSIVFTGKVTSDEARHLYAKADCFVMPSLSEPFGLVALEAIAHGTPVILSKQSGASEVIGHAFKVDFWDTDKMADCALTILREVPLARQLRSEAPRAIKYLTWQHQASIVKSIYENLISSST